MNYLYFAQIIVSVILIVAITLQNQSGGLGGAFGSSTSFNTKRGMEKSLFSATIVLAIIFTVLSVIGLIQS